MPTEERIHDVLRDVMDPEIGLSVEDLGLVYAVDVAEGRVHVAMTMTTPACPLSEVILDDARERIRAIAPPGAEIDVELVWEPPWSPDRMSEYARQCLG
jgi:metal-sulfur cluster biosynthetic enzyme